MAKKRVARLFTVVAIYATDASAPTLAEVQAAAAPLVAQLLAQVFLKRQHQKTA